MGEKNTKNLAMTSGQSLIASVLFVGFFVVWFFWTVVGENFICWIGGKDNLSGWVQAIGSLLIIGVTIFLWGQDKRTSRRNEISAQQISDEKFKIYLASNHQLLSQADIVVKNYRLWSGVVKLRKAKNLQGFREYIYLYKQVSEKINDLKCIFSSFLFPFETPNIPPCHLGKIIRLHNIAMDISVVNDLLNSDDIELIGKYLFNGSEEYPSSDLPNIDELESVLNFNLFNLKEKINELDKQIQLIKRV